MGMPLEMKRSIITLAQRAAILVDAYTAADRNASTTDAQEAEARRRDIWMQVLETQKLATTRVADDAAGVLFQIDIATEAAEILKDNPTLPLRDDLETIASVLVQVRRFIEIAFPGAENPARKWFEIPWESA